MSRHPSVIRPFSRQKPTDFLNRRNNRARAIKKIFITIFHRRRGYNPAQEIGSRTTKQLLRLQVKGTFAISLSRVIFKYTGSFGASALAGPPRALSLRTFTKVKTPSAPKSPNKNKSEYFELVKNSPLVEKVLSVR